MIELASGFQRVFEADWRAIAGDVPVGRSDDGLAVGPIYGLGTAPGIRRDGPIRPWDIVQTVVGADVSDASQKIRAEIEGGATGIELVFASSPSPRSGGLPSGVPDWSKVFEGVEPVNLQLRIDAGEESGALAPTLLRFLKSRSAKGDLAFAFDPIATLAAQGQLTRRFAEIGAEIAGLAQTLERDGVRGCAIVADGRLWHAGGASEAEELAAVLAAFVEYLRLFEHRGLAPQWAAGLVGVTVVADADQFMTIAKLRAMRLLHARLLEAAEIDAGPCRLHSETSWRMLSRLDPHTNILRTTSAVFAAAIGGADSVTALPFDAVLDSDDPFARRIARNSQSILIEEAGLSRVADPGAGAGAIETLTNNLAEAAWNGFRAIEAEGGLLAAVRSGSVQRAIAVTRDRRLNRVQNREIDLVGVNTFPDPTAGPLPSGARKVQAGKASDGGSSGETAEALRLIRLAEPFEKLGTAGAMAPGASRGG